MSLYVCATRPEFKEKHSPMTVSIAMAMKSFNSTLYCLDSAPARFFYYISNILNNISSRDNRGENKGERKSLTKAAQPSGQRDLFPARAQLKLPLPPCFTNTAPGRLGQGTAGTRAPNGDKGHQTGPVPSSRWPMFPKHGGKTPNLGMTGLIPPPAR